MKLCLDGALAHDGNGNMLNTNADTIAGEVAKALSSVFDVTLIYCFEKKGVLRDENDDNSVISSLIEMSLSNMCQKELFKGNDS